MAKAKAKGRKKKSKTKLKLPHGFKSKAQMRFFFANPKLKKTWAIKIAHRGRNAQRRN